MRKTNSCFASALAAVLPFLPSAALAIVGDRQFADVVPGHERPEWVIWAALGAVLLILFFILFATQGGWRGKRGGKIEPPYF